MLCLAVLVELRLVTDTDRQTDRQTQAHGIASPYTDINERLFEVRRPTDSHIHPKSGSIKEMARQTHYYYTWVLLWWRCRTTAAGPPYNVSVTFRRLQDMSGSQFTGKHSLNSIIITYATEDCAPRVLVEYLNVAFIELDNGHCVLPTARISVRCITPWGDPAGVGNGSEFGTVNQFSAVVFRFYVFFVFLKCFL